MARKSICGDSGGIYVLYLDICQSLLLVRLDITIAAARLLLAPVREEVATKRFCNFENCLNWLAAHEHNDFKHCQRHNGPKG